MASTSGNLVTFQMDLSEMRKWLAAWRAFPYEAGKWTAKYVNDMAFKFQDEYLRIIAGRYTIRDPAFLKRTIKIDKAKPRSHMADIVALVGTWYGTSADAGDGGSSIRFSGFEEEITGKPSAVARPKRRVITPAGREGRNWRGTGEGWARMHPGQYIPAIDRDVPGNVPEESRFAAMVRMMAEGKIKTSPSKTFILRGGKYKPGLYRFKGGALPVKEAFNEGKGEVEMIQLFKDEPILPPRWDWRGMAEDKMKQTFTPDYIFENYIAKAILQIMPEKKPWPGK
ncbi:MAG: hypothetical protein LBG57_05490 [Treponema sp.]|jgi:hypothetical protein|nr:hypothetical protein [Treponema sp.]